MTYIAVFLLWTLVLYVIHRAAHYIPGIREIHMDHHKFISKSGTPRWHWNNLFLFNDTWKSTADLWVSEVIPTLVIAAITGHWWIAVVYYVWAAFFQENLEHNPEVNYPLLTTGQWHLIHHRNGSYNFGLFFPIWDKVFGTERKL